jgi:hypothetical protein
MLTSVVASVQWANPHFQFFVDVKNVRLANWKFEGCQPTVLNWIGWKRNQTMLPAPAPMPRDSMAICPTPSGR